MTKHKFAVQLAAFATAFVLHAGPAVAEIERVIFSGFGTLGVVATDVDELQFVRIGIEAENPSQTNFGSDSVLGVQGNFGFGNGAEAVVQVLSRRTTKSNYTPRAALAFISFAASPELTLRTGRLRVPAFMLSDSLDINYAYPWVRPPVEVYTLNPFADLDGVDVLYRTRIADVDLELHPYFGRSRVDIFRHGHASLSQLRGLNIGLSRDELSLHLGYSRARLNLRWGDPDFDQLKLNLNSFPGGQRMLAEMEGNNASASFISAGFHWDGNPWQLIGEYAIRRTSAFVNSASGWHLTIGRHIRNTLPYLKLAHSRQDSPVVSQKLSMGLSAIDAFNASRNSSQQSVSAGLRWDLHPSAALKVELARNRIAQDGWGPFHPRKDTQSTRVSGRTVNTLSLTVDVVF